MNSNKAYIRQRIVVAMSGGVDSSTVACLLKDQGHEVIGITLQLYDHGLAVGKKGACCAGKDIYDAQRAAEKIGIPHYVFDYETAFKEEVIDKFIDSYIKGETPVPCILCNQKVKFKDLLRAAQQLNADAMATGHYVRKIINNGKAELHKALDENKDQSYFLFTTTQAQLEFLSFPLGDMHKNETRNLARQYGLEVADKQDSQDICFVPDGNYRQVIEKLKPTAFAKGNIIDSSGKILGQHNGIVNYTIGQRRGIGLASDKPLYVIALNAVNNEVIIGPKEELSGTSLLVKGLNWLEHRSFSPKEEIECIVKLRSTHSGSLAKIKLLDSDEGQVELYEKYFAITPGQACVAYSLSSSQLLGGGWIVKEIKNSNKESLLPTAI